MKNKLLLGALLISTASLFTACQDDKDSNPTLIQPTAFTLNVPAYANEVVDLYSTEFLQLTWSQPRYTSDNAPVNITYEIQISPWGTFTVAATIPIALFMGVYLRYIRPGKIGEVSQKLYDTKIRLLESARG